MFERVPCKKFRAQDHKVKLSGFIPPELLTRLCYSVKRNALGDLWKFMSKPVIKHEIKSLLRRYLSSPK